MVDSILKTTKKELGTIIRSQSGSKLRLWQVEISPGERPMQLHFHERFEISMILRGEGVYSTENRKYDIKKGDIFVFSSNETHCITNVSKNGLTLINLHFDPMLVNDLFGDGFTADKNNFCYCHNEKFESRIPFESAKNISSVFSEFITELSDRKSEYESMCCILLEKMIIELIRDYDYLNDGTTVNQSALSSVSEAKDYINKNLTEKITLDEIASHVGLSPAYFSSLFKKTCNISLWDYVISKRIGLAIKMLNGDGNSRTMIQTALACGFNNTANFNKAFKRQMGMTPVEYIKSDRVII